jgi:hypothetical protein
MCFFWIYVFLKLFFHHHIYKQIFNTFFIDLHLISLQLNWKSVKFEFHSICSFKWNLIFTKLIHVFINWSLDHHWYYTITTRSPSFVVYAHDPFIIYGLFALLNKACENFNFWIVPLWKVSIHSGNALKVAYVG